MIVGSGVVPVVGDLGDVQGEAKSWVICFLGLALKSGPFGPALLGAALGTSRAQGLWTCLEHVLTRVQ